MCSPLLYLSFTDLFAPFLRSLFQDSDDDADGFVGDLDDLEIEDEYVYNLSDKVLVFLTILFLFHSDDMLRGPVQELDLGSDDEEEELVPAARLKGKRSKQLERPSKIIPTGSDDSSDSDASEDEDDKVTMANMEARSRALDAKAAREAELDLEETQQAALEGEDDAESFDGEADEDGDVEDGTEAFELPTPEEREQEKAAGGPQVHIVQRRMRECVRVLSNLKRYAGTGR